MDAYLERFERFAKNNKWQEDVWATRLSALLTGKSLEFYSRLSREEADDYRKLKWLYFDTMTIPRKAIGGNSEVANRRKVKPLHCLLNG